MAKFTPSDFSNLYNNRARVPDFEEILRLWDAKSAEARAGLPQARLDVPYGKHPLQRMDIIPAGPQAPILFFIHGGYWRMMDKAAHTFLAPHWVNKGVSVVLPNYRLAPEVSIADISMDVVEALAWTWRHAASWGGDRRRIVVAGHSAGGHLTAMALSCRWSQMAADLPDDLVTQGVAISGIFDLAPLLHCEWLQPDLQLTQERVASWSPALWTPPKGREVVTAVGGIESSEFLRQSQLLQDCWGSDVVVDVNRLEGRNHFDVLFDLQDDTCVTTQHLARQLGV